MKFNQWTLGLTALKVVSPVSAVKAHERIDGVQAAFPSTTISGYVVTSIHSNPSNGNAVVAPITLNGPAKSDGFSLIVFQSGLDKGEWESGYRANLRFALDVDLFDIHCFSTSENQPSVGDFAIRQAYVALRTPVTNGVDFKVCTSDTAIGFEVLESGSNSGFTRSHDFTTEPTTYNGVLLTYLITDKMTGSASKAETILSEIMTSRLEVRCDGSASSNSSTVILDGNTYSGNAKVILTDFSLAQIEATITTTSDPGNTTGCYGPNHRLDILVSNKQDHGDDDSGIYRNLDTYSVPLQIPVVYKDTFALRDSALRM